MQELPTLKNSNCQFGNCMLTESEKLKWIILSQLALNDLCSLRYQSRRSNFRPNLEIPYWAQQCSAGSKYMIPMDAIQEHVPWSPDAASRTDKQDCQDTHTYTRAHTPAERERERERERMGY